MPVSITGSVYANLTRKQNTRNVLECCVVLTLVTNFSRNSCCEREEFRLLMLQGPARLGRLWGIYLRRDRGERKVQGEGGKRGRKGGRKGGRKEGREGERYHEHK